MLVSFSTLKSIHMPETNAMLTSLATGIISKNFTVYNLNVAFKQLDIHDFLTADFIFG